MRKLIIGLLLTAGLFVFTAGSAAAQDEDMDQLIEELEQVLLYLALHDSLDSAQTGKVRGDLANIHRRMSAIEAGSGSSSSPALDPAEPVPAELPEALRPPDEGMTDDSEPLSDQAAAGPPADVPLIEDAPMVDLGPMPDKDGGGWSPWAAALRNVSPDNAAFAGWKKDSRIDLSWGEYGEVKLDIANGEMSGAWTIREAYDGNNVNVNVISGSDGNIIIQVSDDNGRHDFLVTQGGAGQLYQRTAKDDGSMLSLMQIAEELVAIEGKTEELQQSLSEVEAELAQVEESLPPADSPSETAQADATQVEAEMQAATEMEESATEVAEEAAATEVADGERVEWEARYKAEVQSGSRERYPAMDWFMEQAASGTYSNPALSVLGSFLNADSGEGHGGAIGELVYSVNGNEKTVQFPDPRQDTTEFINFINKAYILTQSDTDFSISLYY